MGKNNCLLLAIVLMLNVLFLGGCGKGTQTPVSQMPPALVSAVKSVKLDIPWDAEYPAQVSGSLEVEIRAQVGGILKERLYNEGQYVKKGDILFTIDPEQYRVALDRAEASLAQVNTEVQKAQRDYYRMKELIKDNAVSQKDYDDSLSAFERAKADYKAADAVVQDAKISLGYSKVRAPISGIARKENHSVGSLISVGGDNSLLTTMVQINPLYVNFALPSSQIAALKDQVVTKKRMEVSKDKRVDVLLQDGTLYKEPGRIIFFDSAEDPNTASIAVKAEVKNPDYSRDLTPGQFVRVRIVGVTFKGAVIVPQSALVTTPNGYMVYTVNTSSNNVVEAKPVQAGMKDSVAVISSGLEGGETVVSAGTLKIRPGMTVSPDMKTFTLPETYQAAYNKQYGAAVSSSTVAASSAAVSK